jgi:hypothetical protein
VLGIVSNTHAQWTITTYLYPLGNPPITHPKLADQYFTGAKPQRFTGMGNFTARVTGIMSVNTAESYDFFTRPGFGYRFRLDLNQNGTFEDSDEIVPRVPGAPPFRSNIISLAIGNYAFEISGLNNMGPASFEAGYRVNGEGTAYVIGDASGGIGLVGAATVNTVGALVTDPGFQLIITNFSQADSLRTGPNEPGFPVSETREVFNILDFSQGSPGVPGDQGAPGLRAPNIYGKFDDNFLVVGSGTLVVPARGITDAIFRSTTDDGGRLLIDTNQDGDLSDPGDIIINDDVLSGPHNFDSQPVTLAAGNYAIEYSFFERGGQAEGEVTVRLGDGLPFTLLGDDAAVAAGVGLEVIPEPSTLVLVCSAALVTLGARCRR